MHLIRSCFLNQEITLKQRLKKQWLGVTIGNFDGMHLGHQELFQSLREACPESKSSAKVLMSFTPHPRVFFSKLSKEQLRADTSFHRIDTFRERFLLAEQMGFDAFFLARFSDKIANSSAKQFVKHYLVDGLGVDHVVVGDDWRFGARREGDTSTLIKLSKEFGFSTTIASEKNIQGLRVSTSKVKEAILAGDLDRIKMLLGRNLSLVGRVMKGQQLGRQLGFPTANIRPSSKVLLKYGVYAVKITSQYGSFNGVTNVGVRPTVNGEKPTVETHILTDENLDLYGEHLKLEFIRRIRDEKKFASVDELKQQIKIDCSTAMAILEQDV